MQLYKVDYFYVDDGTRFSGSALVTGENVEDAQRKLSYHLDMGAVESVRFKVSKLKPQIHFLRRKEKPVSEVVGNKGRTKSVMHFVDIQCGFAAKTKEALLMALIKRLHCEIDGIDCDVPFKQFSISISDKKIPPKNHEGGGALFSDLKRRFFAFFASRQTAAFFSSGTK